jgi:hypothetical protein
VLVHTLKVIALVIILFSVFYYISIFQLDLVFAPLLSNVIDESIGFDQRYLPLDRHEKIYNSNRLEIQNAENSPYLIETQQQQEVNQVNTTIISALDGNNNTVNHLGSTNSNFINFTFSGNVIMNCDDCFLPIPEGEIPSGKLKQLNDYLADNEVIVGDAEPQIVENVTGLCDLIESEGGITEQQLKTILTAAFSGNSNDPAIDDIIECLESHGLILEDTQVQSQGFFCSLDGGDYFLCTGNVSNFTGFQVFENLSIELHTFSVKASYL